MGLIFTKKNGFAIIGKKFLFTKQLNDELTWVECSEKEDYKRIMLVFSKRKE